MLILETPPLQIIIAQSLNPQNGLSEIVAMKTTYQMVVIETVAVSAGVGELMLYLNRDMTIQEKN